MLATVQLIREQGLDALAPLGIKVKEYDGFILLNYSQINSPKFHPVVDECRGLILAKDSLDVLCRSFDRFYNYSEDPKSNEFPINDATVLEKIDGSLIRIWYNPFLKKWCAATRKMAFCEGTTPAGVSFISIVERVLGDVHNYMVASLHDNHSGRQWTYIFELVSPENRVVKPYGETALYRLAVRHNETGEYAKFFWNEFPNTKCPQTFYFNDIQMCIESMASLPSTFDEGYVACYNDWRIKIKNPAYLAIAHLRNNGAMSIPRIVSLVWSGDEEEYLSYFPEDRPIFEPWIARRDRLKAAVIELWHRLSATEMSQKEYALAVKDLPCAVFMFKLRKGVPMSEVFNDIGVQNKASDSLIGILEAS